MSTEVKLPLEEEQPLALRTPRADERSGEVAAEQTHGRGGSWCWGDVRDCGSLYSSVGEPRRCALPGGAECDKLAVVAADANDARRFACWHSGGEPG